MTADERITCQDCDFEEQRMTCQDCKFWKPGYIEGEDDFIPPMCRLHGKPAEADYYCEEGELGNDHYIAFVEED